MATIKQKTVWFCTSCGNESPKWMGRCPACGEWNTMVEEKVATGKPSGSRHQAFSVPGSGQKPVPLAEIDSTAEVRISLNNAEMDRILGGGLVEGSLVLIGGEPGIGKSTLSLQIPLHCKGLKTLYVTGEESARQVKLRAARPLRQLFTGSCHSFVKTVGFFPPLAVFLNSFGVVPVCSLKNFPKCDGVAKPRS